VKLFNCNILVGEREWRKKADSPVDMNHTVYLHDTGLASKWTAVSTFGQWILRVGLEILQAPSSGFIMSLPINFSPLSIIDGRVHVTVSVYACWEVWVASYSKRSSRHCHEVPFPVRQRLRSASSLDYIVPRTRTKFGDRA